jgi:hypothetical protein
VPVAPASYGPPAAGTNPATPAASGPSLNPAQPDLQALPPLPPLPPDVPVTNVTAPDQAPSQGKESNRWNIFKRLR